MVKNYISYIFKGSELMYTGKVISLEEYRNKKSEKQKNTGYPMDKLEKTEEDDRANTFNLFMRVLSSLREEIY